tara:strand:+ start:210 stop:923 length:714 start_codon:yes stop_codon:yes gene_type:complete
MTIMLEARALRKSFGGLVAVDDVSFTLSRAERVALIGPNGAGKSTCFNLLSGEAAADTGRILLDGIDISRLAPHMRQRAGLGRTFQIAAVFRSMTVSENVTTALIAAGRNPDNRRALLTEVGLADSGARPVTDLAYGDIKRVEMAMALAARPKVLLLDEPTAGMAGPERTRIMETAAALADRNGTALLFTEHDMDAVFDFADRILVMDQGRLIADGTPDEIRDDAEVRRVYLGDPDA